MSYDVDALIFLFSLFTDHYSFSLSISCISGILAAGNGSLLSHSFSQSLHRSIVREIRRRWTDFFEDYKMLLVLPLHFEPRTGYSFFAWLFSREKHADSGFITFASPLQKVSHLRE